MKIRPIELRDANLFVGLLHRHHKQIQGHRFSLACWNNGDLCGVAICGRPGPSTVDPLKVLDVTRLCTDGTKNACSMLYGAAARAAKAIGYYKIETYLLEEEHGASLRASGWTFEGMSNSRGHWHGRAEMQPEHLRGNKQRWSRILNPENA